jgi:hypothetical protein
MTQTEFTGEDNEFEYAGYDILVLKENLSYTVIFFN